MEAPTVQIPAEENLTEQPEELSDDANLFGLADGYGDYEIYTGVDSDASKLNCQPKNILLQHQQKLNIWK